MSSVITKDNTNMSLVTRKPVFGVCDQGRLKPACAATEARQTLEISDIETRGIILSNNKGADQTAPLLFAYGKKHVFS